MGMERIIIMSDLIVGGINFGNMCNHIPYIDMNFIEEHKSNQQSNKLKYLDLLKLIYENAIDQTNLRIKDDRDKIWTWSQVHEGFIDKKEYNRWGACYYLLDDYCDKDLITLEVQILPKEKEEIKMDKDKARKLILQDIELTYVELSLKLDYYKNDEAKRDYICELLKVYSVVIKFLGRRYTR